LRPEIVEILLWHYKTIVVIKRLEQTTISNKQIVSNFRPGGCCVAKGFVRRQILS